MDLFQGHPDLAIISSFRFVCYQRSSIWLSVSIEMSLTLVRYENISKLFGKFTYPKQNCIGTSSDRVLPCFLSITDPHQTISP
jgi:hypothetical protein